MLRLTKNPFVNAILASVYIAFVVSLIQAMARAAGPGPDGETILIPMAMLSLLVLSVSVMGFLFILEPAKIYMDGRREEAIAFFLKTVATFAIITGILFALLFTII